MVNILEKIETKCIDKMLLWPNLRCNIDTKSQTLTTREEYETMS